MEIERYLKSLFFDMLLFAFFFIRLGIDFSGCYMIMIIGIIALKGGQKYFLPFLRILTPVKAVKYEQTK
jgi:hypothetical protein